MLMCDAIGLLQRRVCRLTGLSCLPAVMTLSVLKVVSDSGAGHSSQYKQAVQCADSGTDCIFSKMM